MPAAAGLKGGEAVAQSMVNALGTYLNTEIDAISTAWGDSVPLPHVPSANIYTMLRKAIPAEGVAIVVTPFSGRQLVNHATDWGQIAHRIEVDVVCQSDDQYIVQAQLDRYLTAIWQVVMKYPQLDSSIIWITGCDPVQYARSTVYPSQQNPALIEAWGAWEVDIYVDQLTS